MIEPTSRGNAADSDEPLLTVAAVRALKADYEADVRLLAELPARVEQKKVRLDAATLFLPSGFNWMEPVAEQIAPSAIPATAEQPSKSSEAIPDGRISWTGEMTKALAKLPSGITHKDLLAILKKTELGERQSTGEKGFYNAIGKLAEKGVLVKSGGLLYHRDVADRIKATGASLPDMTFDASRRAGSSASFVVEALQANPKGLTAPALKQIVGSREDAPKSLREHGQYIYNILSTLMGSGAVSRRAGVYKLTRRAVNEA